MTKMLLKAAAAGQNAKLEVLLTGGADINFLDKAPGRTALIEAAIAGHVHTVNFLIQQGADQNLTDRTLGYTALGWAVSQRHPEIVNLLLAAGSKVDLTSNDFQHSPLMIAAREGLQDTVTTLLSAGANVHVQTATGDNALSMAEENDHSGIAALLRAHGAIRPELPKEEFLPWPTLATDLCDVDYAAPSSVLRGFILAMHRWEVNCMKAFGDKQVDFDQTRKEQDQIFAHFCTPKPRVYGRHGSFSSPPEYTAEEALVSVDSDGHRSTLMTRQDHDRGIRYEMLYTLIRKNGRWLVDSKKSRPWGTKNWTKAIL